MSVVCAWASRFPSRWEDDVRVLAVASIEGVRQPAGDPATAWASPERVVLL